MKSSCFSFILLLLQASAELIFQHLPENQSLDLSCRIQDQGDLSGLHLSGLHLYHRGSGSSQVTLLSLAQDGDPRVHLDHRARLRVSGGLGSPEVNVTITGLKARDSGLYAWELSYRESTSDLILPGAQVFLLVQETTERSCQCSSSHSRLLMVVFTAVGLMLLLLCCLVLDSCMKLRADLTPLPAAPIYEEMTRKQQSSTGTSQNNQEAPSHLQEENFPIYANPNFRPPQDNYYACPRQLVRA